MNRSVIFIRPQGIDIRRLLTACEAARVRTLPNPQNSAFLRQGPIIYRICQTGCTRNSGVIFAPVSGIYLGEAEQRGRSYAHPVL